MPQDRLGRTGPRLLEQRKPGSAPGACLLRKVFQWVRQTVSDKKCATTRTAEADSRSLVWYTIAYMDEPDFKKYLVKKALPEWNRGAPDAPPSEAE